MAYVLGYFAANGCMFINPKGSRYILFTSTDLELINKIKILINSNHKIGTQKYKNPKWKNKKTPTLVVFTAFACGNKQFLKNIFNLLKQHLVINGGYIYIIKIAVLN